MPSSESSSLLQRRLRTRTAPGRPRLLGCADHGKVIRVFRLPLPKPEEPLQNLAHSSRPSANNIAPYCCTQIPAPSNEFTEYSVTVRLVSPVPTQLTDRSSPVVGTRKFT